MALCWTLAVMLAFGGWPVPALQELLGPGLAWASEETVEEAATEAGTQDEAAVEESQEGAAAETEGTADEDESTTDEATSDAAAGLATDEGVTDQVADDAAAENATTDAAAAEQASDATETDAELAAAEKPDVVLSAQSDGDEESDEQEDYPYDARIEGGEQDGKWLHRTLYNDQDYTINFTVDERVPENHEIEVDLGILRTITEDDGSGNPGCKLDPDFSANRGEDQAYTWSYDRSTRQGSVTVHGAWIHEHLKGVTYKEGEEDFRVEIWLMVPADTGYKQAHPYNPTCAVFFLREATVDYDREGDRAMLPGWGNDVYRWYNARVSNAEHPDGENVSYEVVNVQSSNEDVVSVEYRKWDDASSDEGTDHNWHYEAKSHGTATLTVTYRTVDGSEDSYTFKVTVAGDVYGVDQWMGGNTGSTMAYPGNSLTLVAQGVQHRENDDDLREGFSYTWEAVNGRTDAVKSIDVTEGEDGTSVATVSFKTMDELGESGSFDANVCIRVTATKDGVSATSDQWLEVSNDYPEIWIPELNDGAGGCVITPDALPLGQSLTVTPQVWRFTQGADGHSVCDLRTLRWNFDENALSITDAKGNAVASGCEVAPGTFTLTRTGNWDTNIDLWADWHDPAWTSDDGMRQEHAVWRLNDTDTNIWFEDSPDTLVVEDNDSALELPLNLDNVRGNSALSVRCTVGLWDNDSWTETFVEGTEYTVDDGVVTLKGAAIAKHLGEGEHQLNVRVLAEVKLGDKVLRDTDHWVRVVKPGFDYDNDREWDRTLLPGWDGDVRGTYRARVWDAEHPDGEDFDYHVTGVEVVSGAEYLEEFDTGANDGGFWCHYRAKEPGDVELQVSYHPIVSDGAGGYIDSDETDSYTFKLHIGTDVYEVGISATPEDDNILPGDTVQLYATGRHKSSEQKSNEAGNSWYEESCTDEGLSFGWKVVEGEDVGTLTVDPNDPAHATFVAKSPSAEKMGFDDHVHIRAFLYDGGEEPVADTGWAFDVRNVFVEPRPAGLGSLQLGEKKNIDLTLKRYTYGEDAQDIKGARFYFWYDTNCVSITDAKGNELQDNGSLADGAKEVSYPAGTYTITRTGDWGTNISMRAVWYEGDNGDEHREYWRNWRLDNLDMRLWFDGEHDQRVWVSEQDGAFVDAKDATQAVSLSDDLAALVAAGGATVEWQVGTWDNEAYVKTFGPERGLYTVSADGLSLTSNAAAMAAAGIGDLRVTAYVTIAGKRREADGDFWFHLQRRERSSDLPDRAEMLPGWTWDDWIGRDVDVFLYDEEHDHEHQTATVTGVTVDKTDVATVTRTGNTWAIEAKAMGEATVTITYVDVDGQTKTWDVPVCVSGDVYRVEVGEAGEDVWYAALPGASVTLPAAGWHDSYRDGEYNTTQEGLRYEWQLMAGDEVGTVTPSADGKSGTITFRELGEDDNPWGGTFWVRVLLYDGDGSEPVAEGYTLVERLADLSRAVVTLEDASYTYDGTAKTPAVTSVTFLGQTLTEGEDYTVSYADNVDAGDEAKVIVTGCGNGFGGQAQASFSIAKAAQPMTAAAKKATQTLTYNPSAAQTITAANAYTVSKAQGSLTYKKKSGNAGITVASNGTITVAKGLSAGSYPIVVTVTAAGNGNYLAGSRNVSITVKVNTAASTIKLAAQSKTYTGKALAYSGKVTKTGSTGKVTYTYYSDAKCTKVVKAASVKAAKVYYVKATVAADGNYAAQTSAAVKFTINKAAQPMAVKAKTGTVKFSAVKKKAQTLAVGKVLTISKRQGTLSYVKKSGNSKITINKKTGKVTIKKGLKKGTYKVKVRVTAAGNANYKSGYKDVTFKVVVK